MHFLPRQLSQKHKEERRNLLGSRRSVFGLEVGQGDSDKVRGKLRNCLVGTIQVLLSLVPVG